MPLGGLRIGSWLLLQVPPPNRQEVSIVKLPQLLVLLSFALLLLSCSQIGRPETIDGWELLSDIPEAVQSAEVPSNPTYAGTLCRNAETGDEVRGVFDRTGRYFPVLEHPALPPSPWGGPTGDWCIVPTLPNVGSAKTWSNVNKNPRSLEDIKIDVRSYVFHPENKLAMPVESGPYGPRHFWYLVGYTR